MKITEITSHASCVYCLEFPNGMKYVGKTKDLAGRMGLYLRFNKSNKRLSDAFNEFGVDSVDISVLREVKCNDDVDLDLCLSILEIKYIRELGTVYPNGYNVSLGGEVLGVPVEHITTDSDYVKAYSSSEKCVLVYDLDGKLVDEYPSVCKLAYDKGWDEDFVRGIIGRMTPIYGKWYLRYKRYGYTPTEIDIPKVEVRARVKYEDKIIKRVIEKEMPIHTYVPALKYNSKGEFCGEYKSKREACRTFTNSSNIGWGEYHNGYILFKKRDNDYPKFIEPMEILALKQLNEYYVPADELPDKDVNVVVNSKNRIPLRVNGKYTNLNNTFKVAQYDLGGNLIKVFDNMRDASAETGIAYSGIWACVMGRVNKCKGYKWVKYEE